MLFYVLFWLKNFYNFEVLFLFIFGFFFWAILINENYLITTLIGLKYVIYNILYNTKIFLILNQFFFEKNFFSENLKIFLTENLNKIKI